jgi:tRNA threonylcarbamoyladenosine biosynthesis protein TsaB
VKVLAIDTATERCSVALRIDGQVLTREIETPRGHADLILPMVKEVLSEGGVSLRQLDGLAYGRGPGAFTGVRIAIGVVQGLAFGADLPTVGISNLAAVAQQVAQPQAQILVCMDARMQEVYWGTFVCESANDCVSPTSPERVGAPDTVEVDRVPSVVVGTGFGAYPLLNQRFAEIAAHPTLLPRAHEIALLGESELAQGRGRPAAEAQPVYLRDNVAIAKK